MDKCHLCLGTAFLILVLWFFAWMSAVIKNIYILQAQIFQLPCSKLEDVCHVSPATSGKKMFYRYILISQIDPIQPCL